MHLVLLIHPPSLGSVSMSRFPDMIRCGMVARGHTVDIWTSTQKLGRLPLRSNFLRKWLGYGDQFLIYPRELLRRIQQQPADTLFVVTDQALGMWVPHLAHRPHVIHCHDFLALRSALGEFPENPTGWTGRQYQRLIRNGFAQGRAFISVSQKTREDLHRFLPQSPTMPRTSQRACPYLSEVVHNGLNHPFRPMGLAERMPLLKKTGVAISESGFIVHVGGNPWYKNRRGVLEIYRAYAAATPSPLPLWLIGNSPTPELRELAAGILAPGQVHFLAGFTMAQVNAAYSHAKVLLFPSLEEGFGWPIVEAMASGCPVITTDQAPMTEVGGHVASYIPRRPRDPAKHASWAKMSAAAVMKLLELNANERAALVAEGQERACLFAADTALNAYEQYYVQVLAGAGL